MRVLALGMEDCLRLEVRVGPWAVDVALSRGSREREGAVLVELFSAKAEGGFLEDCVFAIG